MSELRRVKALVYILPNAHFPIFPFFPILSKIRNFTFLGIHFWGDILHILGAFRGKFCLLGGHFGPGPRQDKDSPPRDLGKIRISW